jgi:hypothetical protein
MMAQDKTAVGALTTVPLPYSSLHVALELVVLPVYCRLVSPPTRARARERDWSKAGHHRHGKHRVLTYGGGAAASGGSFPRVASRSAAAARVTWDAVDDLIGQARADPLSQGFGKYGAITRHSALVRSVWYRVTGRVEWWPPHPSPVGLEPLRIKEPRAARF